MQDTTIAIIFYIYIIISDIILKNKLWQIKNLSIKNSYLIFVIPVYKNVGRIFGISKLCFRIFSKVYNFCSSQDSFGSNQIT